MAGRRPQRRTSRWPSTKRTIAVHRMPAARQGPRYDTTPERNPAHSISSATPMICNNDARANGCTSAVAKGSSTCFRSRRGADSPAWRTLQLRPAPRTSLFAADRIGCTSRCRTADSEGRNPHLRDALICSAALVMPARVHSAVAVCGLSDRRLPLSSLTACGRGHAGRRAQRTTGPIHLDGRLDEPDWGRHRRSDR